MAEYRKQKEKNLYAILGVPKTADEAQIKKAYRKLAKKYHPDMNTGNSEAENRFLRSLNTGLLQRFYRLSVSTELT